MKKLLTRFLQPAPAPAVPVPPTGHGNSVHEFMASTQRELALFAADMMGAQTHLHQFGAPRGRNLPERIDRRLFRNLIENSALPLLVVDPRPGLRIVDANAAYSAATMTACARIAGEKLFDTFPDNPDARDADGVCNLYESLQKAAQGGHPHAMAVQRYDVRNAAGQFIERHWQPRNTPIFDEGGRLVFLLHHVREVGAQEVRTPLHRSAA